MTFCYLLQNIHKIFYIILLTSLLKCFAWFHRTFFWHHRHFICFVHEKTQVSDIFVVFIVVISFPYRKQHFTLLFLNHPIKERYKINKNHTIAFIFLICGIGFCFLQCHHDEKGWKKIICRFLMIWITLTLIDSSRHLWPKCETRVNDKTKTSNWLPRNHRA